MAIPDDTWLTRCRLWTRLLDLLVGLDDETNNAADTFASQLDASYTILMNDAYNAGRREGFEAGQHESTETIASLRQRIELLEKDARFLTDASAGHSPLITH